MSLGRGRTFGAIRPTRRGGGRRQHGLTGNAATGMPATAFSPLPQPPARPRFPWPRRPTVQVAWPREGHEQQGGHSSQQDVRTPMSGGCMNVPRHADMRNATARIAGLELAERCSVELWPGSGWYRSGPDAGAVAIRVAGRAGEAHALPTLRVVLRCTDTSPRTFSLPFGETRWPRRGSVHPATAAFPCLLPPSDPRRPTGRDSCSWDIRPTPR